ncbi:MAG: hypothetical protein LBM27_03220 [Lactobacillaceae bacterium]|jgi:hypothetical protein|nr:hypothetical protein [Lactobacillaceae bacterium]
MIKKFTTITLQLFITILVIYGSFSLVANVLSVKQPKENFLRFMDKDKKKDKNDGISVIQNVKGSATIYPESATVKFYPGYSLVPTEIKFKNLYKYVVTDNSQLGAQTVKLLGPIVKTNTRGTFAQVYDKDKNLVFWIDINALGVSNIN